jgi:hypothetical protein
MVVLQTGVRVQNFEQGWIGVKYQLNEYVMLFSPWQRSKF